MNSIYKADSVCPFSSYFSTSSLPTSFSSLPHLSHFYSSPPFLSNISPRLDTLVVMLTSPTMLVIFLSLRSTTTPPSPLISADPLVLPTITCIPVHLFFSCSSFLFSSFIFLFFDSLRYAGLQNGAECYCGNSYGSQVPLPLPLSSLLLFTLLTLHHPISSPLYLLLSTSPSLELMLTFFTRVWLQLLLATCIVVVIALRSVEDRIFFFIFLLSCSHSSSLPLSLGFIFALTYHSGKNSVFAALPSTSIPSY